MEIQPRNAKGERLYTSAQVACVLGPSRRHTGRLLMLGARNRETIRVHGRSADAWAVCDFAAHIRERLQHLAQQGVYDDVEQLLDAATARWEPQVQGRVVAFGELPDHHQTVARARCEIFAPPLTREPLAEVARIIREARPQLDLCAALPGVTDRTARLWVERAKDRDRLRYEWRPPELWLDDKLSLASNDREAPAAAPAGLIAAATDLAPEQFWTRCAKGVERLIEEGLEEAKARARVLSDLREIPRELATKTPEAMAVALKRRWRQFVAEGTVADRRSKRSGRLAVARLIPDEHAERMRIAVANGASQVTVLRRYAESTACPEAVRESILNKKPSRHKIAPSLRQKIEPPPSLIAKMRGDKVYDLEAFTVYRNGNIRFVGGGERPVEPGDLWIFDDMSWNFASCFPNPDGTGPLAEKHGVSLGRQGLWAHDLASGRWLGVDMIGRDKDAYRAEDILRLFRKLLSTYGLPRVGIILERGVWHSDAIKGKRLPAGASDDEDEEIQLQRRLSIAGEFGIDVQFCRNAKGKGHIETGFGYLQRNATTFIHSPTYGKTRGEFTRDNKVLTKVQAGRMHPSEGGIPSMAEMSKKVEEVMLWTNAQEKEGFIQKGIPDQRWLESITKKPLLPLPMEKLHVLFPMKRPVIIKGGHVHLTIEGDRFGFTNPDVFSQLGNGRKVWVCFDPTDPSLGATILNYEASSEWGKADEYLCQAKEVEAAPSFLMRGASVDDNVSNRKAYNRAFSSYFIAPGVFGKKGVRAHEHRDGRGNVSLVEHGGAAFGLPGMARPESSSDGGELIATARRQHKQRPEPTEEEMEQMNLNNKRLEEEAIRDGYLPDPMWR